MPISMFIMVCILTSLISPGTFPTNTLVDNYLFMRLWHTSPQINMSTPELTCRNSIDIFL